MTDSEQQIERPSTLRSGILLWVLQYASFLLGVVCIIAGVSFIIMGPSHSYFTEMTVSVDGVKDEKLKLIMEEVERLTRYFGMILLVFSPAFFLVQYLCKVARIRNNYIETLESELEKQQPTETNPNTRSEAEGQVDFK